MEPPESFTISYGRGRNVPKRHERDPRNPIYTLHLLSLTPPPPSPPSSLPPRNTPNPPTVSRVIRWIIPPTHTSLTPLSQNTHWDLLLVLPSTDRSSAAPKPHPPPPDRHRRRAIAPAHLLRSQEYETAISRAGRCTAAVRRAGEARSAGWNLGSINGTSPTAGRINPQTGSYTDPRARRSVLESNLLLRREIIKSKMVPSSNYWYGYGIRTPLMNLPLL